MIIDDPDGDLSALTLADGPASARVVSGRLRVEWIPSAEDLGAHTFLLVAQDTTGLRAEQGFDVIVSAAPSSRPPTPLSPDRPLDFAEDYGFLFEGDGALQQGVSPGTIDKTRLALLHGMVTTREGASIDAVRVSIKSHPELGFTFTSTNGRFHLALNGGGAMVVRFERPGFLPAEREIITTWHAHTEIRDVALVPLAAPVTVVDMGAGDLQVARGPVDEDADGARQATILIPPATTAEAVLPDGRVAPMPRLSLRATEYTIGALGAAAMPASLPASSGYTYALEISADEALELGATTVRFSRPVPFYVENFLGFPVGEPVPVGSYDFERSTWNVERDGRVIAVIEHRNGQAQIDLDGDGAPESDAALAGESFTPEELAKLAELYRPGSTLWRVLVPHLTPWDHNWPFGPQEGAAAPSGEPPARTSERPDDEDPCEKSGSVIECDDGGLGEDLPIPGTAYTLHYRSRRQPGWKAGRTVDIPISGPELPPGAGAMILELEVAGRAFREVFEPRPSFSYRFIWDGKDVFDRPVYGRVPLKGRIGFAYRPVFRRSAGGPFGSFGAASAITIEGATRKSENLENARAILWRNLPPLTLEAERVRRKELGGWSLDVQHQISGARIELGDGRVRTLAGGLVETVAGATTRTSPFFFTTRVTGVAVAPDGAVYAVFCDAPARLHFRCD